MSSKILCVGLVTVDIVQICSSYPVEDSDQRCIEHYWQRGGNASNNCTVLAQLGAECEYFGTISGGIFHEYLKSDFKSQNININNCVIYDDCECPTSIVIINAQNGSRTIVHANKNLPELTVENFKKLDLSAYSWIHFEGRNTQQVISMIEYAITWRRSHNYHFKLSVELEKPRPGQDELCNSADVVFVGKDYALFKGYKSMEETVHKIRSSHNHKPIIISAWGECGATGLSESGLVSSPAFIQPKAIDTLGAGDTFCAAVILGLNEGVSLQDSIKFGCQIAGVKVGITGLTTLKKVTEVYCTDLRSKAH